MTAEDRHRAVLDEVLRRAADSEAFEAWRRRAMSAGWCRNPVRLVGRAVRADVGTGEVMGRFASADLPDRVLLKACGHRRATRCPTCSATYQADAYQLVSAGLRGGKGVPESVGCHPMVFLTLTAPSFGAVHSADRSRTSAATVCRPGVGACDHRIARACSSIHETDDALLGQPICADCFDYAGAVLWNAHAGELWRRTTIAIQRSLASLAGISRAALRDRVRVSYSKVVEYQRRGVVHLHAVVRLDSAIDVGDGAPAPFDELLLSAAVTRSVATVAVPCPPTPGASATLRWGGQFDLHPIGLDGKVPVAVAGYLAKYATKSTDPAGILDRRLRHGDLDRLDERLTPHLARMVRTAWDLGGRPELEHLRLRAWAHTLGFRGHWLTKSRRYSTTFAALRSARHDWNLAKGGGERRDDVVSVADWQYAGRGWMSAGDAWLAETAGERAADARLIARLERRTQQPITAGR